MSPDEIDLVLFNRNTSIHLEEGINVLDQVLGHQLDHCQSEIKRIQDLPSLIKQEYVNQVRRFLGVFRYLEDEIFGSGQSTPIQSPARSSGNESCSAAPRRVKGHYDHYKDTSGKINLELVSLNYSSFDHGTHVKEFPYFGPRKVATCQISVTA